MNPITNYYQLINIFRTFAADHKQIKCFGYGTLTDIESPMDPTSGQTIQRDYPYMFINPTNHTYTQSTLTFRFNVIVMELTSETTPNGFPQIQNTIKAQSDALLILNDFMAWLEYNREWNTMLVKNTGFTPFQERFQDTVAGMTATIELQIPNKLNLCDAPTADDYKLILSAQALAEQDLTAGVYLQATKTFETDTFWINDDTFTMQNIARDLELNKIEIKGRVTIVPTAGQPTPLAPQLMLTRGGVDTLIPADEIEWPNAAQEGINIPFKLVWRNLALEYENPTDYDTFKFINAGHLTNTTPILIEQLQMKFYEQE